MKTQDESRLHQWEAWIGQRIVKCYTDEDSEVTTIIVEDGRGAGFKTTGLYFMAGVPQQPQDEHLPTLEGVIDYLERQNEQAFLAYRRLERGSEPGMHKDVRIRLMEYAYEQWQATGEALHRAKEAAKNPGPGVTYIDTINGMLDRHFGAGKVK